MSFTKVGYACGVCPVCGRKIYRPRPADLAICDCFKVCPLCGREMTPYIPDLTPSTYGFGEPKNAMHTLYYCTFHSPPYYSKQKPVEVQLS